jgi:hypothetical protein
MRKRTDQAVHVGISLTNKVMKKSRIYLSVAFALAIVAAVFTKVQAQPDAYIQQDASSCVLVERPIGCVPNKTQMCTILDVTYFQQATPDQSTCLTPYFFN